MASSAIKTAAVQLKAGNIQNQADTSAVYSDGEWSFKNSSAVASVTIKDDGKVGIGVDSPASSLHVKGETTIGDYTTGTAVVALAVPTGGDAVIKTSSSTGKIIFSRGASESMRIGSDGNVLLTRGENSVIAMGSTAGIAYTKIAATNEGAAKVGLAFSTTTDAVNSVERMRLDASGNLLVGGGLTSPLGISRLSITYAEFTSGNQARPGIEIGTTANKVTYLRNETDSNGVPGAFLRAGGDINLGVVVVASTNGVRLAKNGTSWGSYSDERLKDITGEIDNALDKVTKIRAVKYAWKNDEQKVQRVGVIAQDVQKVLPEVVDTDTDYLQVRYSEIVPLCLKAIQEQQAMIEELKAKVSALESK